MKEVIGAVIMVIFIGITCFIKDNGVKPDNPELKQNNIPDKPLTVISPSTDIHLEGKTENCIPETNSIFANKIINYWIY